MQGKSTFLDAIACLLGGKKYMPTQPHNTESGGATALLRAVLSNGIEVERSGKSATLKVKVDGAKGNQGTLKAFLNEFALDIDKFMRASEMDKGKMLMDHLGVGEELDFLDKKIEAVFSERTVLSREVKRKVQLAGAIQTFPDTPESALDVVDLMGLARKYERENAAHLENKQVADNNFQLATAKADEIAQLKQEIEELRVATLALTTEIADFEPHNVEAIEAQITNAATINQQVDANAKAAAAQAEAKASKKEEQALTDTLEESRQQRAKFIDDINMPLPGLAIDDGILRFNGQQWDCMSGAERLKVATAIARSIKPECGFVLIDELEQMDWSTISDFDAWAKAEGIQIIGAMVCDEAKSADNVIIISNGKVKDA